MNRALCAGHNLVRMVSTKAPGTENDRLDAALRRKESAFHRLVESHRAEFHAHCYRMLGSLHDAEDALQDALLRAWRGLPDFDGRSSLRTWLHRIATNACLDAIRRRPKRVLPIDYGPPPEAGQEEAREPVRAPVWIEPYPDRELGIEDARAAPEARYEQREAVELAFIAALQHLPARQRAVLILRDVLGFSAKEAARALDATPTSIHSLLQRAHASLDHRLPERSQQATLRSLGDQGLSAIVDRYVQAWATNDVDALVEMLTESATLSMPPTASWLRGRHAIVTSLRAQPLNGTQSWRLLPTSANAQPALGLYLLESSGTYVPHHLAVLTLHGVRIDESNAFHDHWAPERVGLPDRA